MFYFDTESRNTADEIENVIDDCSDDSHTHVVNNLNILSAFKKLSDYYKLHPLFSWLHTKVINNTFEKTT